jgi:hypothetical protein
MSQENMERSFFFPCEPVQSSEEGATGGWIKLHDEELRNLDSSPDIMTMKWARHVASIKEKRTAYRVLVAKPKGKRPLGRPRRRWEGSIETDLTEIGLEIVDWIHLTQNSE